jgi:hypothetical protein
VNTIKQIVKRTYEETKAHPSASQDVIESIVLERLKNEAQGLPPHQSTSSSSSSSVPPQAMQSRPMNLINASSLQQNKNNLKKDAIPNLYENKENCPNQAKPLQAGGMYTYTYFLILISKTCACG